jgi:hypothetical protein
MASLSEIRVGLADALSAIEGIQASPYMLSNPTPPAAHVFPDQIDYDKAMARGLDDWFMTVQAFVGLSSDIGAQERLDVMLAPSGPASVKAAIEADRTLGGVVGGLRVESCSGYRTYQLEAVQHLVLGAEWRVHVLASGQ